MGHSRRRAGAGGTHETAALRELAEEMVLTDVSLGPVIWLREHIFPFRGRLVRQQEHRYLARITAHELPPTVELAHREDGIAEHRWWTLAELEQSAGTFAPRRLPRLLRALLKEGWPATPIDVGV